MIPSRLSHLLAPVNSVLSTAKGEQDYYLSTCPNSWGHFCQALLYNPTTTESICLQIRKIVELIAFSSLIANKEAYASVHQDFAKHWNAKRLLADLERVNPDFFPTPVIETRQDERTHCTPVSDGFLTKSDFVHVYEKCGGMLHARNPYDSRNGYHYADKSITGWMEKIVNLLKVHTIKILGQEGFWLIHMHEKANDKVYVYQLEPYLAKL